MANITPAEALTILPLALIKDELRIPSAETSHDILLTSQIVSAVSFVSQSTDVALADLPALRPAIVAAVRSQYDGGQEIRETAAAYAWMAPFRKIV